MSNSSKTRYAILGMLSINPMSGYEIRQQIQQSTANFWSESEGQIYPTLTKLDKEGCIACDPKELGVRAKKIFTITDKGRIELKEWLEQESNTQIIRHEFLLKLFFGANVKPEINLEHLQVIRYQTKNMLTQLEVTRKNLLLESKNSPHLPYWNMSIQYGKQIGEAKLKWCDEVINALEKMKVSEKI